MMVALRNALVGNKEEPASGFWGLKFTAKASNSTVRFYNFIGYPPAISIDYSMDNGTTWNSFTLGDTIYLNNVGDSVCFAASDGVTNLQITSDVRSGRKFSCTGDLAQTGSLLSLVCKNKDDVLKPSVQLGQHCFRSLFSGTSAAARNSITEHQFLLLGKTLPNNYQLFARLFASSSVVKMTTDITSWGSGTGTSSDNYFTWFGSAPSAGEWHCPAQLGTDQTIERGFSRCPEGWTVINDV